MRKFPSGATRDDDTRKPDYEGFESPLTIEMFGRYMLKHQVQADGQIRDSANWQLGMPVDAYMKSLLRHVLDLWKLHRGYSVADQRTGKPVTLDDALCAVRFNVNGYMHEVEAKRQRKGRRK